MIGEKRGKISYRPQSREITQWPIGVERGNFFATRRRQEQEVTTSFKFKKVCMVTFLIRN